MTPPSLTVARIALDALSSGLGAKSLDEALSWAADFEGDDPTTGTDLAEYLRTSDADDPLRLLTHNRLASWDAEDDPPWAEESRNQTLARRHRIYELLGVDNSVGALFSELFPPRLIEDPGFKISQGFEHWYEEPVANEGFYWPRYRDHLRDVEGWDIGVEDLTRATRQVVERLGNPKSEEVRQTRGLVVGFVQSGKTANFTGVIARAIDAGYRLIIVLAGTTNLLRSQTQRRIDKQLIGRESLLAIAEGEHYDQAPDWAKFIAYGGFPRDLGGVDMRRLTSLSEDYRRLGGGLGALGFDLHNPAQALNTPVNLANSAARIAVIKKNRAPLESLAKDLRAIAEGGVNLAQIPSLIIDDESDQATINTRKPSKKDIERRTAINRGITDLLGLLPRAQYVGYTATPFANVFVDPNDELSVYPRDFIIGLDRPEDYMGAADYHDFGAHREGYLSNEKAFARSVYGGDLGANNLRLALDLHLLTGAIKLYRAERECEVSIKHHTMLVHTSEKTAEHEQMATAVRDLLDKAGYSDGSAESRLSDLLDADLRPVSEARKKDLPFPSSYSELRPYIATCLQRLQDGDGPVLIVNGRPENEEQSPDFDRDSVWAVIVGGTKLSRGYTVEGLTISYYRRSTRAADTLMQMGRWFGFRRNYEDLMRLFIGRAEGSPNRPVDLYAAFEAVCQDEMELRKELGRYALPSNGDEPITPLQVPVLVTQHLPSLPPTAPNKMWNADLISENLGGEQVARTLAPTGSDSKHNLGAAKELLRDTELVSRQLGPADESFRALVGEAEPDRVLAFLSSYRWSKAGVLDRAISYLEGKIGDPCIDSWSLVLPLLEDVGEMKMWKLAGDEEVPVIRRYRDPDTGRFGVYTTPVHVRAARAIANLDDVEAMTAETRELADQANTAVALLYAVRAVPEEPMTIGFSLFPPPNSIEAQTKWGVHSKELEDQPIIEATE